LIGEKIRAGMLNVGGVLDSLESLRESVESSGSSQDGTKAHCIPDSLGMRAGCLLETLTDSQTPAGQQYLLNDKSSRM
jgi:hypothetical protein